MGLLSQQVLDLAKFVKEKNIKSICMIGKQDIHMTKEELSNMAEMFSLDVDDQLCSNDSVDFFHKMGVERVCSLDISDYEGADIILDLNSDKLDDIYVEAFDLVIDGGTLEHVFNQYNAIKTINSLVSVGGYIYHMLPCVGYIDHGFYSFSPTYFRDIYTKDRGWNIYEICFFITDENSMSSPAFKSQDCRWFKSAWELEKYARKQLKSDCGSIQIECIAEKISKHTDNTVPSQGIYNGFILDYNVVLNLESENGIVLYGSGEDANEVMNVLYKNNKENLVQYIFDSDINKAGMTFRGKKIKYPNRMNLESCIYKILISSSKYEEQIYRFLLNEGVEKQRIIRFQDLGRK